MGARSSAQQIALGMMLLLAVCIDIVRKNIGNKRMLLEQEKVYQQTRVDK